MGGLERRIRKLEAHAESAEQTGEGREQLEFSEVLSRLSDEDLHALDEVLRAALERWETSGTFEDLYEVVNHERGRWALARFIEVLEDLRRGEELPPNPPEETLGLIGRVQAGNEKTREEYRI